MRQTLHVCVTAWGYLHLFGGGCISTWLPVCEEQSKWLNSSGENLRFKRVGRTHPNVAAVAFISPGKTTQRIKRDTSMTYERRGIPPLYVHACSHLYRKRGSGHESTFMTVKDNEQTGTNCFPPDYDGRFQSHFDTVTGFILGGSRRRSSFCFVCALMLILSFCPSSQWSAVAIVS